MSWYSKNSQYSQYTGLGYGLDSLMRIWFPKRQEIFLSSPASISALGPTQPPTQWVMRVISVGRQGGVESADA
jgi:hypothetical protein